jgi:hypothetical protein
VGKKKEKRRVGKRARSQGRPLISSLSLPPRHRCCRPRNFHHPFPRQVLEKVSSIACGKGCERGHRRCCCRVRVLPVANDTGKNPGKKKVWLEKKSVERNLEIGDGAGRGSKTRRARGARSPSQGPRRGGKRFLVTFSNRVYIFFLASFLVLRI